MQTRIGGNLGEEVDWLADHANERRKFTCLQLLQGGGIVIQHLLDLDPESLKDNRAGETRSASSRPCLLFASAAGVRPTLVAYRGTGPALIDLTACATVLAMNRLYKGEFVQR